MINWILKNIFRQHVCESFTPWGETKVKVYTRPCRAGDGNMFLTGEKEVTFTRTVQERKCVVCGLVQQRVLNY